MRKAAASWRRSREWAAWAWLKASRNCPNPARRRRPNYAIARLKRGAGSQRREAGGHGHGDLEVTNSFGDVVSHPKVIVDANSVDDIIAVLKDVGECPAPVGAVGSDHSTSPCGVADGGTLIRMKMNPILNIGADTITVDQGARHIDMARELENRNLQFYVNAEIGSLTAGSAACAAPRTRRSPANTARSAGMSSASSWCCRTAISWRSPRPSRT